MKALFKYINGNIAGKSQRSREISAIALRWFLVVTLLTLELVEARHLLIHIQEVYIIITEI